MKPSSEAGSQPDVSFAILNLILKKESTKEELQMILKNDSLFDELVEQIEYSMANELRLETAMPRLLMVLLQFFPGMVILCFCMFGMTMNMVIPVRLSGSPNP